MGEKLEEKSLLCWGCEAAFTEHLAGCVRPLRQKGRGGEPLQLAGSWLLVLPAVPAQPHCGGRGRDGRGAGPSGSDTLWCCGGGRQEWALQGSRRAYRDSWEGGRSRVCSTAAFPSLICSKWERLVRLLDVISQGPGCGGQEGLFFGFLSKRRWVFGPGWGCTGAETSWLLLISLTLPCPRSEREAKESFPEGEYVCNLMAFLS